MKANNLPNLAPDELLDATGSLAYYAILRLIDREGGDQTTNRKTDRGGLTRWGIAQKFWPDYDVLTMTKGQAILFYYQEFWLWCQADDLPAVLVESVFDMAVNQGIKPAIRCLQKSVGSMPDGVIGPMTLAAIRRSIPFQAFFKFQQFRQRRYVALCRKDRTQMANLNGWLNRMTEVQRESLLPRLHRQ